MDQNYAEPTPSEAHPDSMDFLSRAWCDFAVQALQPSISDKSIVLVENSMNQMDHHGAGDSPLSSIDRRVPFDDGEDFMSMPWQSNDVQSWISMQQAIHPEVNYRKYFGKSKVTSWKMVPPTLNSIRKWIKDLKLKRKEDDRLQRAELHAAISVAGVAAALAAIAAENAKCKEPISGKEVAMASAAALVARQCAKVAESMGAKKEELHAVIGSALTGAGASEILTLTAAAATSLRGAETLKERARYRSRLAGSEPVLPIDENAPNNEFDFKKWRAKIAGGTELRVETPDGNFRVRSVSIKMTRDAKVILELKKNGLLKRKQESIITQMHAELYKADQETQENTCYIIVLTTRQGLFKLDMGEEQFLYEAWATTIDHMFTLCTS